jgi:hypothetical protein
MFALVRRPCVSHAVVVLSIGMLGEELASSSSDEEIWVLGPPMARRCIYQGCIRLCAERKILR